MQEGYAGKTVQRLKMHTDNHFNANRESGRPPAQSGLMWLKVRVRRDSRIAFLQLNVSKQTKEGDIRGQLRCTAATRANGRAGKRAATPWGGGRDLTVYRTGLKI